VEKSKQVRTTIASNPLIITPLKLPPLNVGIEYKSDGHADDSLYDQIPKRWTKLQVAVIVFFIYS
jgi:hypothetical protein